MADSLKNYRTRRFANQEPKKTEQAPERIWAAHVTDEQKQERLAKYRGVRDDVKKKTKLINTTPAAGTIKHYLTRRRTKVADPEKMASQRVRISDDGSAESASEE